MKAFLTRLAALFAIGNPNQDQDRTVTDDGESAILLDANVATGPELGKLAFFTNREDGASLAEYGLLLALIAVVCIAAISLLGTSVQTMFNTVASTI